MIEFFKNEWFSLIFFTLFIVSFFITVVDNIRVRIRNKKLNKEIEKSIIEYFILAQKHEDLVKSSSSKEVEQTDGFLRFISESRDWAFSYIEEVQKSISKLQEESSKVVISGKGYLLMEELEGIRKAIAEVIRQLPEKTDND